MQDLAGVLSQFSVAEHLYDDELLATFLSIQESYFIMGSKQERAEAKKLSLSLMLPYFKDDALLLEKRHQEFCPAPRAFPPQALFFSRSASSFLKESAMSLLVDIVWKLVSKKVFVIAPLLLL